MATTDQSSGLDGLKAADPGELIPGATELEQALLDGRLIALRRGDDGSSTWIPAPGAFDLVDPETFAAVALAAAERSREARGLPAD